jgi:CRISPR/Cas system-associated protein Csm6
MTTILTTTGISLNSNTKRDFKADPPTDDQMRQYLRMNPKRASSEANSLLQMARQDDYLILLHTQTPEAIKCADLLRDYFHNEG